MGVWEGGPGFWFPPIREVTIQRRRVQSVARDTDSHIFLTNNLPRQEVWGTSSFRCESELYSSNRSPAGGREVARMRIKVGEDLQSCI